MKLPKKSREKSSSFLTEQSRRGSNNTPAIVITETGGMRLIAFIHNVIYFFRTEKQATVRFLFTFFCLMTTSYIESL